MRPWLRRLCVLSLVGTFGGLAADVYAQGRLTQLMRDKLTASQRLLEGIALADYNAIGRNADELIRISRTAEWLAYKTNHYEMHSNDFRRAAEQISTKAKAKNIDGVMLAYHDLVNSCVRCHKYVREIRDARQPLPELTVPTTARGE